MTYYYMTESKGKCGCSNYSWNVSNKYKSKAELKRRVLRTIKYIFTEEELFKKCSIETAKKIIATSRPY